MLALCSIASIAYGQTGIVKGMITSSDGKPAPNINVSIEQTNLGAISSDDGTYTIHHVPSGQLTMKVSAVGIAIQQKEITTISSSTLTVDFVVNATSRQLKTVTVNAGSSKFVDEESDYVAKMPLKNLENPQVYSVVTGALMKEQVITDYTQALNNIPGAMGTTVGDGNGGNYVTMRGFYTTGGFRDGLASVQNAGADPVNIEKIEAIKGPTGTLFGSTTSYGGLINRVTKKPYDSTGGEINYFYGTNELNRLTVDYNTPLNKDKSILFRVNGALHNENSFQDYGYKHNVTIDPSFLFRISDKLNIVLNTELYNSHWTQSYYMGTYPSGITNIKQLPIGYKQSLTGNSLETNTSTINNYIKAEYTISPHWKSVTAFSTMQNKWQPEYFLWYDFISNDSVTRSISKTQMTVFNSSDIQQNFMGDFNVGNIRNRVVAGVDYYYYKQDMNNYNDVMYDTIALPSAAVSPISTAKLDELVLGQHLNNYKSSQNTFAVYASDAVNITENFIAMASLRVDHFHNGASINGGEIDKSNVYNQTALSPKFGLVYQPVKNHISIFASYTNAFSNNGPTTQPDGSITSFKPENANQFEGGVKTDAFNQRISGSISYFNILVKDKIRLDNSLNRYVQDGSQRNAGVEVDIKASPFSRFNIVAGYTHLKSRYLKVEEDLKGKTPSFTADDVANFWIDYSFKNSIGVAFGGNYVGEWFGNSANTFVIPAYTVLNASVFYQFHSMRLALKVNNIGNKQYWDGNELPQPLRQFVGNISYDF